MNLTAAGWFIAAGVLTFLFGLGLLLTVVGVARAGNEHVEGAQRLIEQGRGGRHAR